MKFTGFTFDLFHFRKELAQRLESIIDENSYKAKENRKAE